MARHDSRDKLTGRFTKSGAPIPNADGSGADPIAYDGPEYDPDHGYPEFRGEYPTHELRTPGSPLRHRRQVVVDAQTGEQLDAHITHVRALDTRSGAHQRQAAHLAAAQGDPFIGGLMGPRGEPIEPRPHRVARGTGNTRLRSDAVQTDDAPYDTGSNDPLFR